MGMQGQPLLVTSLIDHAAREHAKREIVSRWADGSMSRTSWAEVGTDARRFAAADPLIVFVVEHHHRSAIGKAKVVARPSTARKMPVVLSA